MLMCQRLILPAVYFMGPLENTGEGQSQFESYCNLNHNDIPLLMMIKKCLNLWLV